MKLFFKVLIGLAILFTLIFIGFGYFFYKAVDGAIEEGKRVAALPELHAVITSGNQYPSPLGEDSVAFFLLDYSLSSGGGLGSTSRIKTTDYKYHPTSQALKLSIDNVEYTFAIDPYAVFLTESSKESEEWKLALTLAFNGAPTFKPNLIGLEDRIDCAVRDAYKDNWDVDVDVECKYLNSHYTSADFTQFNWRQGDSISFKGEIVNGQIQLLN
tara:strand:- start:1389 stop:2030 length:642 start_codon:yes stop_codon:yes gene_type:complete